MRAGSWVNWINGQQKKMPQLYPPRHFNNRFIKIILLKWSQLSFYSACTTLIIDKKLCVRGQENKVKKSGWQTARKIN